MHPELFHQRGYLARVLTADAAGGMRDDGVQPLSYVLDEGGPDALAATLEGDGIGAIYPVVYTAHRRQGRGAMCSTRTRGCGTTRPDGTARRRGGRAARSSRTPSRR